MPKLVFSKGGNWSTPRKPLKHRRELTEIYLHKLIKPTGTTPTKVVPQRRDIQRGNRHLDNLNFCVTRSTRHAKSSSQCRRWNFIAKDRENAVRKVKIAFFLKIRYSWKFCSINYCRITVSDHFYWFPFIKSANITFYFFPIYSLLKSWNALAGVAGNFRCFMYKKQSSKLYKFLKI
jgi:hypothetical protein